MRSPRANYITATILAFVIGLHWPIVQSFAWVGMVVNYSWHAPIQEAFVKTFDGKHPCKLCKWVKKGLATERKANSQKLLTKPEFIVQPGFELLSPAPTFSLVPPALPFALCRIDSPPTPPPRSLTA